MIEESWDRFGRELTFNANAAVNSPIVTIDATALHASNVKTEQDSYYALRTAFVPLFEIYLPNVPSSLDALEQALKKEGLTRPFLLLGHDEDVTRRNKYKAIFERFGTHYVKGAWVGGKASLVFTVAKSSNLTEEEIRFGIQASVGDMAHGGTSIDKKNTVETFKNNSSCRVFGNGGDKIKLAQLTKLDDTAYDLWLTSVKDKPEVIEIEIAGIWTLVQNEVASKALQDAYLEETSFVSLQAVVPLGPLYYFLDRNDFTFTYRPLPPPGESKSSDPINPKQTLSDALPALRDYLNTFARPDAAFALVGFGHDLENVIDFFSGEKCLRMDNGKIDKDQFPKAIEAVWPGVNFDRVDAAVAVPPNRVYFFRGSEYIRVDVSLDGKGQPSPTFKYRDSIKTRWPGVIFDRLDTASYFPNSKMYFFSGDQYIRYDLSLGRADSGYPKYLNSNYADDWELFDLR